MDSYESLLDPEDGCRNCLDLHSECEFCKNFHSWQYRDRKRRWVLGAIAVTWTNLVVYAVSASDGCVPNAFIGW